MTEELEERERDETGKFVSTSADTEDTGGHPLDEFRDYGGVRHSEYEQAETVTLANGDEISSIALAAAGTTLSDGSEVPQGVREATARNIDASVRQHAAWLDSRPLIEQVRGAATPVIFIGPTE